MKKLIALIMASMLCFALAVPVSASTTQPAEGLEAYMSLTDQGLISFDAASAIRNGFSLDFVARCEERAKAMNDLVLNGVTTITPDFTARVYLGTTRSNDTTYIEYNTYGYTVYYSVADTQTIVDSLPSNKNFADLSSIMGLFGKTAALATYGLTVYTSAIRQAASNGTGIYIQIYDDGTTARPMCFVGTR